jgi:hypothetical protein
MVFSGHCHAFETGAREMMVNRVRWIAKGRAREHSLDA